MPKPSDTSGRSVVQEEVDRRCRCYQEAIVRRLYLRVEDFELKNGWVNEKGEPIAKKKKWTNPFEGEDLTTLQLVEVARGIQSELSYTACDVLDYQPPSPVPCDKLKEHPVVPAEKDTSIFQAVARLELARADPSRQRELFGWSTPDPRDMLAVSAFEEAKVAYWGRVCASAFTHLEILKETADFKAANLIRVLYLACGTPPHLAEARPRWRDPGAFERDVNFSAGAEERIKQLLLEFKYWGDDPFFVDGGFNSADKDNIRARRTQVIKDERREDARKKVKDGRPYTAEEIEQEVNEGISDKKLDYEMTFWSENHQVLFASAEYLAGQWLRDDVFRAGLQYRGEGPQGTRPGDLTGEQRMRQAKRRLVRWLDDRLRLGFSEWNAPGYYEEDIEPLLNLVDFCLDEEIRSRAELVLDLLVFDLARFNLRGNFGVSAGRCYYNHKMCGYDQSVGDLIEILFGTRGGVIVWDGATSAAAFASSRGYSVPDVLVKIGQDRPDRLVDRSRVSLRFDEASVYGVGFQTDLDALFWWSRSAYFTKQMVRITRIFAEYFHLTNTPPFAELLPLIESIGGAGETALAVTYAVDPGLGAAIDLFTDTPDEVDVVDSLSPLTEGSALTRANLYTYRNRDVMLSSTQNWRRGQFNFQTQVCQATLGPGATVWTTHPSAGGYANLLPFGIIGGVLATAVSPWLLVKAIDATDEPIELIPHSDDGPNWWTGTVTLPRVLQREGAAILAYQPGELMRRIFGERTHAWFPQRAFEEGSVVQTPAANCNVDDAGWTFGKVGDGYVGLFSARPVSWTPAGPWAGKELLAEAGRNIFIIQVGNHDEFGTYEQFKEKVTHARVHVNGLRNMMADFQCSYDIPSPDGGRLELHYDDDEVRYNGAAFSDDNFPRFETPYVKCGRVRWGQYHYTIAFADHTLTHDFRELRTKVEGATVHRSVDNTEHDCEDDRFWVVSNRGAQRVFPENTLEACEHAVEQEGAMALLVDACLTADGEVVLWHDWSPEDFSALLRRAGATNVGAYRPTAPDSNDPLRRETIELTLAQLRFAYGYGPVEAASGAEPAAYTIPTLAELVKMARGWTGLRHLLINVRMPARHAAQYGGEMLRRIIESVDASMSFDLTLLVAEEEVLSEMRASVADMVSPTPIAFSWLSVAPEVPSKSDFAAQDAAIRENSAVEGAIRNQTAMATLSRVFQTNAIFDADYYQSVSYDIGRMEPYNLNPRENKGHQVEQLLAAVTDNALEMHALLEIGVSGIITDDVPALRGVVTKAGRI